MRIIIGGGGTGGHLVPGISVYRECKERKIESMYVLRKEDLTYNITNIIEKDDQILVSLKGISRKISFNSLKQIYSIFREWLHVFKKIKTFNPDAFFITGGYVSNIVALSAFVLRRPLFVLEQNAVAGITNRFWIKYAVKVFTSFPETLKVPQEKILCTGTPLLYSKKMSVSEAKIILKLPDNNQKVLGICSGSQGAKIINDFIITILQKIVDNGYQVIWSLGTREYDRIVLNQKLSILHSDLLKKNIQIYRFIDKMDAFWTASDIVLARSGAGTIAEAILFKKPVLFIPIQNSPDNHQYLNAKFLEEKKCAQILQEKYLTESIFFNKLESMLYNNYEFQKNYLFSAKNPQKIIVDLISEYIKS